MSSESLERHFAAIGARLRVRPSRRERPRIDVRRDRAGEFFEISLAREGGPIDLEVVNVARADRHLLLLMRDGPEKSKFLCGYDERHWFVAAVPEAARGVTSVATAMHALQPDVVRDAVQRQRPRDPNRRRNSAYIRQGEWFFVPLPGLDPPVELILRNEALRRSGGTPHVMQYAYRSGGETVYVNRRHPAGIAAAQFRRLSEDERKQGGWIPMRRNAAVFARGAIRHPDHATVVLREWHQVAMNTEQGARAMRHVAFLD
jgi:hypothetical protein